MKADDKKKQDYLIQEELRKQDSPQTFPKVFGIQRPSSLWMGEDNSRLKNSEMHLILTLTPANLVPSLVPTEVEDVFSEAEKLRGSNSTASLRQPNSAKAGEAVRRYLYRHLHSPFMHSFPEHSPQADSDKSALKGRPQHQNEPKTY